MNNTLTPQDLRIIFLGTPAFAVATLDALLTAQFNVVAVVTAPDKPAGRGQQLKASEVKQFALERNIPVLQPPKLKDPEFLNTLKSYHADIQVVVAFRMLPEVVWNMPRFGTFNVHASLLPQYRGAAPINWCIINGEQQTGITTFKLVHDIDKGNILLQEAINISEQDNAGTIHDKLMILGGALMVKTLNKLCAGSLTEQAQPEHAALQHAPKLFTDDCIIDFCKPVQQVRNLIRGLSPYPGAMTKLKQKTFKIYACNATQQAHNFNAGTIDSDGKNYLHIYCNDGYIDCTEVQLEGKKKMDIKDFLRGYRINDAMQKD